MLAHIICLPTFGSPYLVASVDRRKTDDHLAATQKAVNGFIEGYSRKEVVLHPMFCEENRRWDLARQMMTAAQTKVYVNDEGALKCSPNTATIIINPALRIGGCPHLFGDVCLDVPATVFQVMGFRTEWFKLVEMDYEPEDEAEEEAKKAECAAKGWDYKPSTGFIYEAIC
jgi:hypothetical protein